MPFDHPSVLRRSAFSVLLSCTLACVPLGGATAQGVTGTDALLQAEASLQRAIETGALVEALSLARQAVDLSEAVHGRNDPNTASRLVDLGTVLRAIGNWPEAAERYLEAEAIYTELFGPSSAYHVELQLRIAALQLPFSSVRTQHALRAIQLQRAVAPDDRLAYARVSVRAGALLVEQVGGNPEAERILEEALQILEAHGPDEEDLVPVLSALADASARRFDARNQLRHYDRALRIVQAHHGIDAEAYADLALRAARRSLLLSVTDAGRSHLRNAQAIYDRQLGPDHPKTATARLVQGEFEIARQRYRSAETPLLRAAQTFEGLPGHEQNLLRALNLLVASLAHQGKGDAATEHLLKLAAYQPPVPTQDFQPVVNFRPVYPSAAARRGEEGFVVVEFTVDATGRVRDPVVVESGGPTSFQDAALDAVRQFRYVPRFENSAPVETQGVRNRFTFRLQD